MRLKVRKQKKEKACRANEHVIPFFKKKQKTSNILWDVEFDLKGEKNYKVRGEGVY